MWRPLLQLEKTQQQQQQQWRIRVRLHIIIGNVRIKNLGKYQSCMVSKLLITGICKQVVLES